jgi:hypothetical protein
LLRAAVAASNLPLTSMSCFCNAATSLVAVLSAASASAERRASSATAAAFSSRWRCRRSRSPCNVAWAACCSLLVLVSAAISRDLSTRQASSSVAYFFADAVSEVA